MNHITQGSLAGECLQTQFTPREQTKTIALVLEREREREDKK